MKMILLGPPGAGKGSQAVNLSKAMGIPHISTGDIFRANIKEGTTLGLKVKSLLAEGHLVPDDVTVAIVRDRLASEDCKAGFILDGFPRTIPQAEQLDAMLAECGEAVDLVIDIDASDDLLVRRISGRRMCKCGRTYHVKNSPPKQTGICDDCGAELYTREDDKESTVRERLLTYHNLTEPLIAYYKKQGKIREVNGMQGIDETTRAILALL